MGALTTIGLRLTSITPFKILIDPGAFTIGGLIAGLIRKLKLTQQLSLTLPPLCIINPGLTRARGEW